MSTRIHDPRHYGNLVVKVLEVLEAQGLTVEDVQFVLTIALRWVLYTEGMTPDELDDAMLARAKMLHEAEAEALTARTVN